MMSEQRLDRIERILERSIQDTENLKQQIGGLANKFGSFTEGMALPSMEKVLASQFGLDSIFPRARKYKNGEQMEIDVLGYSNGSTKTAVIVEIKSHLREEGIQQMLNILSKFPDFFPEHADKKLYGILAVVDSSEELKARVLNEGIYLAHIHDDLFELDVPDDFQAKVFNS